MSVSRNLRGVIGVVVLGLGILILGSVISALAFRLGDPAEFARSLRFLASGALVGLVLVIVGASTMGRARLRQARTWLQRDSGLPLWSDFDLAGHGSLDPLTTGASIRRPVAAGIPDDSTPVEARPAATERR